MPLWSSIRFSLRILKKHGKLTSIAVSSLALAMAAGTAGFSVFNALLLRPPAVFEPDRLLTVYSSTPTEEFSGICYDDYTFYRDHNEVFSVHRAMFQALSADNVQIIDWTQSNNSFFAAVHESLAGPDSPSETFRPARQLCGG